MSISFQLGIATEKWKGARDTQRHDLASSPDQKILLIDMDRGLLLGQKANLISCCSLVTIHRQYFRISYILGISSLHPICCAAKQKETAPPLTRITFRTSSLDMANSVYKRKYDRSATVCVWEERERATNWGRAKLSGRASLRGFWRTNTCWGLLLEVSKCKVFGWVRMMDMVYQRCT